MLFRRYMSVLRRKKSRESEEEEAGEMADEGVVVEEKLYQVQGGLFG